MNNLEFENELAVRLRDPVDPCTAVRVARTVLDALEAQSSGWSFWIRLALGVVRRALDGYARERC